MLDGFERHDRVERTFGERQRRAVGFSEFHVGLRRVDRARACNHVGCHVDTGNVPGASREQRAAVALATGDVEDLPSGDEPGSEKVSMPVLVPDLASGSGDEAFAG